MLKYERREKNKSTKVMIRMTREFTEKQQSLQLYADDQISLRNHI